MTVMFFLGGGGGGGGRGRGGGSKTLRDPPDCSGSELDVLRGSGGALSHIRHPSASSANKIGLGFRV